MFRLDENALQLLESRYLFRNAAGALIETPEALFRRVARTVAGAEHRYGNHSGTAHWEAQFYKLLTTGLFLPNSPTLMNAGLPHGQLSACYVLPVEDSIEAIFDTLRLAALIQKSGGGTGFNFSALRPTDDYVHSTGGKAAGPLAFIRLYDEATEHIKQGGKRRGANMAVLNVDHPDIEPFIQSKKAPKVLRNFNISVGVTDAFMKAVEQGQPWSLRHPATGEVVKTVEARQLWDKLVEAAWATGDPGVLFLDTIERTNPTPHLGKIQATNPCGEVPLLPYESCNLGSLNLAAMTRSKGSDHTIDWDKLAAVIRTAVRFLDNVIEVNNYLTDATKKAVLGNRKIGLGVMGWADLLMQIGIPYASDEAVSLGATLMKFIQRKSREASLVLGLERGPFQNWARSIYYPARRYRHATVNSIAPTGSISILAGVSSSIEPVFSLAFRRQNILGQAAPTMSEVNRYFLQYVQQQPFYSEALLAEVRAKGSLEGIAGVPESVQALFRTALHIPYTYHLRHQAAFQQYTDNAVAKTINLPNEATVADVDAAYRLAWQLPLKGVTVYRNGSKETQVLYEGVAEEPNAGPCQVCAM